MTDVMQTATDNNTKLEQTIKDCGTAISKICMATPLVQMAVSLRKGNSIKVMKRNYTFAK